MASAASLAVLFKGDTSGLNDATSKAGGMIGGLVEGLGKLGLAGMGFGVIKDAASAVVGPLMDSIGAAEGLGDAVARSEGVFGPASASIVSAAKEQANALGLTQEAYIAAAAKTGDLVTSMGIGKDKAAEMSAGFADLAPKLAAYTGMDVGAASDALTKGLTGATKGLKEMGIVVGDIPKGLSDAAQAQYIYDQVLKQSGDAQAAWAGNAGDVDTSMARITAAMTDAKATIGEALLPVLAPLAEKFAGLAGTLTGLIGPAMDVVKNAFAGTWGDDAVAAGEKIRGVFGSTIGTAIMQVAGSIGSFAKGVAEIFGGDLTSGFDKIGTSVYGIMSAFENLTGIDLSAVKAFLFGDDDGVGGVWEKIGPAIGVAIQYIKDGFAAIDWAGIGQTIATLAGYFMDGLGVVLPIIADIFTNLLWPAIQPIFNFIKEHAGLIAGLAAAFFALTNPIGLVVGAFMLIGALGPQVGEWITAIGEGLIGGLGSLVGGTIEAITGIVDAIIDTFCSLLGIASPSAVFDGFGVNLLEGLIAGVTSMIASVSAVLGVLKDAMLAKWDEIKESIMAVVETVRVFISAKWDAIKEYLDAKLAMISAAITVIWKGIQDKIGETMQWIQDKINEAWTWVFDKIDGVLADIQGVVGRALDWIESATGVKMDAVRAVFDGAMTFIRGLISAALDFITGDWDAGFEKLKTLGSAGWAAIKQIFSEAWERLKDIINWDAIKAKFDTGKAVLMAAGKAIVDGIKQGIADAWEALTGWLTGKIDDLFALIKGPKGIDSKSPSKRAAREIGRPIGQGIIQGLQDSLAGTAMASIVGGWAEKGMGGGFVAKVITMPLVAALAAGMVAAVGKSASFGPSGGSSDLGSLFNNMMNPANAKSREYSQHYGPDTGPGSGAPVGAVKADAFRSGKGGHLAASKSNYWQVFVQKWGIPTEDSARKVSRQLGIPLPQWLEDIYNPKGSDSYVDPMAPMKDALQPAADVADALKGLAAAASEATGGLKEWTGAIAIDFEALDRAAAALRPALEDLARAANPGPGPGGPPTVPPPGGTTTFGAGGAGGVGIADATINAQAVHLNGPVQVGFSGTFQVGSGRTLAVELVDAVIADTSTLDKLITAEDRRRAQKP